MFLPDFGKGGGLLPAIAQDAGTGEVLMLAYVNEDAWRETLQSGFAVYYSRSRRKLWRKGESSGNVQKIVEILVDCDADTILFKVEQAGKVACHTGHVSCFYRRVTPDGAIGEIRDVLVDPATIYGGKSHE